MQLMNIEVIVVLSLSLCVGSIGKSLRPGKNTIGMEIIS